MCLKNVDKKYSAFCIIFVFLGYTKQETQRVCSAPPEDAQTAGSWVFLLKCGRFLPWSLCHGMRLHPSRMCAGASAEPFPSPEDAAEHRTWYSWSQWMLRVLCAGKHRSFPWKQHFEVPVCGWSALLGTRGSVLARCSCQPCIPEMLLVPSHISSPFSQCS